MSIIESDMNLEYVHAIAMISILVALIYFHVTERVVGFIRELVQMFALYIRLMLNIGKVIIKFFQYIYNKITAEKDTRAIDVSEPIVRRNSGQKKSMNDTVNKTFTNIDRYPYTTFNPYQ